MRISVAICSFNRAVLLEQVIVDIFNQGNNSPEDYEVLVIDNNSIDATREITDCYTKQFSNFRYIFEPRIGLSCARNRGWQEAHGEYVAYLDDDCRIPPGWLKKALEIVEYRSPLAFGGPYLAFYMTAKPTWYKDDYGSYRGGRYPKTAGPALNFNLSGGNLIVRRSILEELDGFDPQLGMTGNRIAYAEEDRLQDRLRKRWPKGTIYFDPALWVYHLVAPHKMHLRWRIYQQFQRGKSLAILHADRMDSTGRSKVVMKFLETILRIGISLLRGIIWRDKQRFPFCVQWIYEDTALYFAHLGALMQRVFQRPANHA